MKWSRRGVSEDGIDIDVRNWGVLFRLSSCSRHEYFSSLQSCQPGSEAGYYSTPTARSTCHNPGNSAADEPCDLPVVNERLYLRLRLPPVLRRRLCTLVGETSQLQLLPGQVEVSARDLRVALAVCRGEHEQMSGKTATHVDFVRLDLLTGRHRRGLFSIDHDATTKLQTLSTWRATLGTRIRNKKRDAVSPLERA